MSMIKITPISNKKLVIRRYWRGLSTWEYSYDGGKFKKFDDPKYLGWKFGVSVTQEQLDAL
jgi:hypothetical protein